MMPPFKLEHAISTVVREDWGRMLASLVASFKDLQLAEDVLQDSIEQAVVLWQKEGLPDSPAAWLITTARRKAIDHFRRDARFAELKPEIAYLTELSQNADTFDIDSVIPDKRLELIFTCCHPAIEQKTQVALTLRTLAGLTTEEVASAYLDKTSAMAQRLSRAKNKISVAGIPFEIPDKGKLNERLEAVLSVIYLIFNEGYSATSGKIMTRNDLCDEAIRLARIVLQLMPTQTEVAGLLCLMLLHDSRRFARQDRLNNIILLEDQNRESWDKDKIVEGTTLLKKTLAIQCVGAYQIQAAISAIHAESSDWLTTDWVQINALYELLYEVQPSAVVRVNHAVATSYAISIPAALELLSAIQNEKIMSNYQPFYATRADLLFRHGDYLSAKKDYKRAIELSDNQALSTFLKDKLAAC